MMTKREENDEGLEKSFASNSLGKQANKQTNKTSSSGLDALADCFDLMSLLCSSAVYILIKSLIPLLEKSPEPRVVSKPETESDRRRSDGHHLSPLFQITVSSGGMLVQKLRTGNLQSQRGRYDGTMVYAQNKVYIHTHRESGKKACVHLLYRKTIYDAIC